MRVVILIWMLLLSACTTTTHQSQIANIAVSYATVKTIEQSDTITAAGVIRYVDVARALVEDDVQLDPARIAEQILQHLNTENLSPADRMLAAALVLQIQAQFEELNLLDPSTRVTLLAVLGWIEQAARLSQ